MTRLITDPEFPVVHLYRTADAPRCYKYIKPKQTTTVEYDKGEVLEFNGCSELTEIRCGVICYSSVTLRITDCPRLKVVSAQNYNVNIVLVDDEYPQLQELRVRTITNIGLGLLPACVKLVEAQPSAHGASYSAPNLREYGTLCRPVEHTLLPYWPELVRLSIPPEELLDLVTRHARSSAKVLELVIAYTRALHEFMTDSYEEYGELSFYPEYVSSLLLETAAELYAVIAVRNDSPQPQRH